MANLKVDLLNELRNQKMYAEIELIRLASDTAMNYKNKIGNISDVLKEIALLNQEIGLGEMYFQEQPVPQNAPAPVPAAQAEQSVTQPPVQAHPGQSHGE
jgi:hypothetical protein